MRALVCMLAGLTAGVAGGMFGLGGGVIIVPFLVIALKYDQHLAQGTSLFALALPVAGLGAYNYYVKGEMNLVLGVCFAAGIVLGGVFGSKIALGMTAKRMRQIFCVFLTVVAIYLFFKSSLIKPGDFDPSLVLPVWAYPASLVVGVLAGMGGGMFGIGGGIVIVPFMVLAFGFSQHYAQGTSLLALTLPVAASGAYNYYKKDSVDVRKALCVAVGIVAGGWLGSKLALGLDAATMQKSFSVFLIAMAGYLFVKK